MLNSDLTWTFRLIKKETGEEERTRYGATFQQSTKSIFVENMKLISIAFKAFYIFFLLV